MKKHTKWWEREFDEKFGLEWLWGDAESGEDFYFGDLSISDDIKDFFKEVLEKETQRSFKKAWERYKKLNIK